MYTPIAIDYTRDGHDWKLTARRSDQELHATAAGLIAARDKADQLVEKLAPGEEDKTVVHMLDGDAFAFTEAYLHARLDNTTSKANPADGEADGKPSDGKATHEKVTDEETGLAASNGAAAAGKSAPKSSAATATPTGGATTSGAATGGARRAASNEREDARAAHSALDGKAEQAVGQHSEGDEVAKASSG